MGKLFSAHRADAERPVYDNGGPSLTRTEFQEDCDINHLMARFEKTGVISHINQRQPIYADLSEMPDTLEEALAQLEAGKAAFMSLPAAVRREFDNDPVEFVAFAADPDNIDQLREWGLAKPVEKAPEPLAVRVVADPAPPGTDGAKGSSSGSSEPPAGPK